VLGRAAQVDHIKLTLKPPAIKRLKLKYDVLISIFSHSFKLRRYSSEMFRFSAADAAAANGKEGFTKRLNEVGQCRLTA